MADIAEIREHVAAYEWVASDSPYLTLCVEERHTLLRLYDALTLENEALKRKLANSSDREQELYLTGVAAANRADDNERKLAAAQSELDAARRDAERYRYWRQHQYNGLLDVDEFCDANSPQAIHFDRITDEAIKAALSPPPREGV